MLQQAWLQRKSLNYSKCLDVVVLTFCLCFSWWLMHHSFQYINGQFVILGRVWSDFAAHIPLIRSFSFGWNFPPEYPSFPGEPIRYHYLFFLAVGMLERAGLNIATALNLLSAVGLLLLLWMIYQYSILLYESRVAGILAIVLFLFNGSLSFLELLKRSDSLVSFMTQLLSSKEYLSFGPWDGKIVSAFWNWNVYANQRHLALSFGLALWAAYPLLASTISKKFQLTKQRMILVYLCFTLFPLLHQAGHIILVGIVVFWGAWHIRSLEKKVLISYTTSIFASFITMALYTTSSSQPVVIMLGYLAKDVPSFAQILTQPNLIPIAVRQISIYWFFNLGLYSLLTPIVWFFSPRKIKLFCIPLLGFFVLANSLKLSTDMINNHKLINFVIIGLNILFAGFFWHLVRRRVFLLPVVLPLILMLTLSGIADSIPFINNHYHFIDDFPNSQIIQYIKKETAPESVFLTNTYIYNPASLAGRKMYIDYGYFNWSMGYPDRERRETLKTLFSANISQEDLCKQVSEFSLDYLLISPGRGSPDTDVKIETSQILRYSTLIHSTQDGHEVYDIKKNCESIVTTST